MADHRLGAEFLFMLLVLLLGSRPLLVRASPAWAATNWTDAHATFYGGQDASGTMGGGCGFGNLYATGYGTSTTALSNALFNNGLTCGACFQLVCEVSASKWCYSGGKSITVTATNSCPPGSEGGWCDPPKAHFDLAYPMFTTLAQAVGGVIPVHYKRVACSRVGGLRFTVSGNPWFDLILVTNVGGDGDVASLGVKSSTGAAWASMAQNWGQNWEIDNRKDLVGQALSFRVTLGSGTTRDFANVVPSNWIFGQTFQSDTNF